MKQCPKCSETYADETLNFCLRDGAVLIADAESDTVVMHGPARRPAGKKPPRQQDIKFCTASDGARVAYSVIGSGPILVRVLGHFTHLEMEWEWADLRNLWESLAEKYTVVRYDGRGIGCPTLRGI